MDTSTNLLDLSVLGAHAVPQHLHVYWLLECSGMYNEPGSVTLQTLHNCYPCASPLVQV